MNEGTNIRAMKLMHKTNPEIFETAIYQVLDYGRAMLMIPESESQTMVLIDLAISIIESEDNSLFTFEEIIYCIRKGATGGYGKTFGKINSEVVNRWLDNLYQEHMGRIENGHKDMKQLDVSTRTNFVIDTLGDEKKHGKWQRAIDFWKNYENEIKENGTPKNANG